VAERRANKKNYNDPQYWFRTRTVVFATLCAHQTRAHYVCARRVCDICATVDECWSMSGYDFDSKARATARRCLTPERTANALTGAPLPALYVLGGPPNGNVCSNPELVSSIVQRSLVASVSCVTSER
jgi:hypothetical protein